MKILANLFRNRVSEANDDSTPSEVHNVITHNVNELLHLLDHYIDSYEINNGLKPERILINNNIHKLFAQAGVYKSKYFGDILVIPATKIKGNFDWQAM